MFLSSKKLLLIMLSASLMFGGCASSESPLSETTPTVTPSVSSDTEQTLPSVTWDDNDVTTDATDAVTVTLADGASAADGDGVTVAGDVITFTQGGKYRLSGQLTNGQLRVDADDAVRLFLDGVSVHSETSSPLFVKKTDKAVLTLMDGTENVFSDSASLVFEDAENEEPGGAVFSKSDLTINGGGTLTVNASFRDGIVSRDGLKIADGIINVTAVDDALMGRDYVLVGGGKLTVQAGGDGIKSTNDAGGSVGFVMVEDGELDIVSGSDGIQSESSLTVANGVIRITAGGGSEAAPSHVEEHFAWGREENTTEEEAVGKGLKAQTLLTVRNGQIRIDAADDALHANGKIAVNGGVIHASSGDDGVHADEEILISDGMLTVATAYEGLEAAKITLNGGEVSLTTTDDGINASSGTSTGRDPMASDGSVFVINGGTLYVDAEGDGLDSNGTVHMTGGHVTVIGPSGGANGTLDFATDFTVEGGTLVALGTMGMVQTPSVSGQNSVVWGGFSASVGDSLTVTDEAGNVLVSLEAIRTANWAYITADALKTGNTVTLRCGNGVETVTLVEGVNQIGNGSAGGFEPGRPGGRPDGMHDFPNGERPARPW